MNKPSFGHMTWQVHLDLLHAQANLKAREAASLLAKGTGTGDADLTLAIEAAQAYVELEHQIAQHMDRPPNRPT